MNSDSTKTNGSVSDSMSNSRNLNIGGQAVIEGVMMRSQDTVATAVRLPDGTIEVNRKAYVSIIRKHKFLDIPVLRGAVNFFEMLVLGMQTLNWSADVQMKYEDMKNGKKETGKKSFVNTLMLVVSTMGAFAVAMGLFFALPIFVAGLLGFERGAFLFNLVAGTIRILLFLLYVLLISKMADIKRIFRYHGAEHMSIYALESSEELIIPAVRSKSRLHPRCGTSFILIVALAGILLFGIADSAFPLIFGKMQSFGERFATHLVLLPVVAGLSYEILKFSGKYRSNRIVGILTAPGLWLQGLTTAEPDDQMIEVAICALKSALGEDDNG